MTTKHTPGPWFMPEPPITNGAAATIRARDEDGYSFPVCQVRLGRTQEEVDANARLLIAAPDMLAALQGALVAHELFAKYCPADVARRLAPVLATTRAAITKAKGGA